MTDRSQQAWQRRLVVEWGLGHGEDSRAGLGLESGQRRGGTPEVDLFTYSFNE